MQALQTTTKNSVLSTYSTEEIDLIKQNVARGTTDAELKFFLYTAGLRGLNPLARQIYCQKRRNNKTCKDDLTFLTGIDGYRLIADRTGKYVGNDDAIYDDETNPRKATVTVYKLIGGIRCPFTASARWDQYYPGDVMGFMWRKMPHLMLAKCAEALALRKAFPEELSGLYIREEMDQAGPTSFDGGESLQAATPVDKPVVDDDGDGGDWLPPPPAEPPPAAKPARKLGYDGSPKQKEILETALKRKDVPEAQWKRVGTLMLGLNFHRLDATIETVRAEFAEPETKAEDK